MTAVLKVMSVESDKHCFKNAVEQTDIQKKNTDCAKGRWIFRRGILRNKHTDTKTQVCVHDIFH